MDLINFSWVILFSSFTVSFFFFFLTKETFLELSQETIAKSIHRNHLHSYILTMKNQKEKLRNQSYSPLQQKELNILE